MGGRNFCFWAGVPWALKMPLGHLVDLIWRWKSILVFLGAGMIAASLGIMIGLLTDREAMSAILAPGAWYVASVLLGVIGYVLQDVVADMPDVFQLRVKGHEDGLWQCQVVWRSENEIGIAILRSGAQSE